MPFDERPCKATCCHLVSHPSDDLLRGFVANPSRDQVNGPPLFLQVVGQTRHKLSRRCLGSFHLKATFRTYAAFKEAFERFSRERPARMLVRGALKFRHYIGILRQIYFQARDNARLQALAANYFRGDDRDAVKLCFEHETQEIRHHALAKSDRRIGREHRATAL